MGSCDFLCWLWAQVLSKKVVQNRRFKQGVKSSGMERRKGRNHLFKIVMELYSSRLPPHKLWLCGKNDECHRRCPGCCLILALVVKLYDDVYTKP